MTEVERLKRIAHMAQAIRQSTASVNAYADRDAINELAEAIRLLAIMPGRFIEVNIGNFDEAASHADRLIKEATNDSI